MVTVPQMPNRTALTHEYGRPQPIEDASNQYFIHPIAAYVVKASIALGLSPNFLSLMGLGCGLLAGYFYYHLPQNGYVYTAFLLMVCWHILDGADGRLARATGRSSAFGRIIDGICDHLVFAAVYIAFALHLVETGSSLSVWWLVLGAGVSHAVQAAAYEERRQKYQRRFSGVLRGNLQHGLVVINGKKSWLAVIYDAAQRVFSGGDYGLDEHLENLRDSERGARHATYLIGQTAQMVRAWGILNANNRTVLIFICALIGQPAFYFAFELLVFNIVLVILLVAEWRLEKKLAAYSEPLVHS